MVKRKPKNDRITREELFRRKERFHKERSKLPFEEKIRILIELQKVAAAIKHKPEPVWKV